MHVVDEKSVSAFKINILWTMVESIPDSRFHLVPLGSLAPLAASKIASQDVRSAEQYKSS